MTATAATIEALPRLGLPERESDQVPKARRAGEAEEHTAHKAQVGAPGWLIRDRVHHATILPIIAAVQLAWLVVLAYGLFRYV
jgi:hypothetical protein